MLFLQYPWKFHILNPVSPPLSLFFSITVCTVVSDCTHPCDTSIFIHSLTRIYLLQLKIHIWMKFSWNQKFIFVHKRNFNPKVIIIFNKPVCWYNLIFPNFSAGNSVIFLTDFEMCTISWQMSFYSKFSCLKRANTAVSKFWF